MNKEIEPVPAPTAPGGGSGGKNGEMQLISFTLGAETFGVSIENVKEILKVGETTPIPRAPDYLMGMMNVRGTILPVVTPKKRLKLLDDTGVTPDSRILVLHTAGQWTGLLVDSVSSVQRVSADAVEPPPPAARGIDRFYLEGVVRLPGRDRLIMLLNLKEVLNIEISKDLKPDTDAADLFGEMERDVEKLDEEQVVTFTLGDEEFGIGIAAISEILKVGEITAVPNVPPYVKGIQDVRGRVLPIIDMRKLVNMDALEEFHHKLVARLKDAHLKWLEQLKETVYRGAPFAGALDPTQCQFGKLLEHYKTQSVSYLEIYKVLNPPHQRVHFSGRDILQQLKTGKEKAVQTFETLSTGAVTELLGLLPRFEDTLNHSARGEQRVLIVNIGAAVVGLLVDRVNEVSRLPRSIIDSTPAVLHSYGEEIKGIAKLEEGKRLILLVDEALVIPGEDMDSISNIRDEQEDRAAGTQAKVKELQYVIFSLRGDEFGLPIEYVREIFKVTEITPVPRAPVFIEGVTNLRGNVIPVVDTRERFAMTGGDTAPKDAEKTILVTLIKDTVVGLMVDGVHEVIRIPENIIEDAPSLVHSSVDTAYLQGIAKLDKGERIILLLRIDEIMNKKDFQKLKKLKDKMQAQADQTPTAKTPGAETAETTPAGPPPVEPHPPAKEAAETKTAAKKTAKKTTPKDPAPKEKSKQEKSKQKKSTKKEKQPKET